MDLAHVSSSVPVSSESIYGSNLDGHQESCLSPSGKVIFIRQARFLLLNSILSASEKDAIRPFRSPVFKPLLVYARSARHMEDMEAMIHGLYMTQLWGDITLRVFKAAEDANVFDHAI